MPNGFIQGIPVNYQIWQDWWWIPVVHLTLHPSRRSPRSKFFQHPSPMYTVSQKKSSTSYFAEYFCTGLTECKNFNDYRVRNNQWTQVCNQCFNFYVSKCCHLANWRVSNWQLCVHKTADILKVSELIVFLLVCCWLINCIGKPFFFIEANAITGHSTCFGHRIFRVPTIQYPAHRAKETVALLTTETPYFIPPTLWPPNSRDLIPVDYCVWNVLQERVYYCTKVDNVVDLKQHIVAEWTALDHSIIASANASNCFLLHTHLFPFPPHSSQNFPIPALICRNLFPFYRFCIRTAHQTTTFSNYRYPLLH